nr:protein STRUBBELIG-RECEPTOR FAMILY 8-like [Ipomoea trifida]
MKMVKGISLLVSVIMAWISGLGFVRAATDPMDLQALEVIYTSLNSPSQLTGWKANGGDPCSESWKGVACQGSDVVSIEISGLGLNGTLGYMLNGLKSLKALDMSSNSIHDSIPYQLPPNLTSLNLAYNNLSGSLPYSLNDMILINYLNLSSNSLYQSIGDVFTNHSDLESLDLSFNKFSGDLPPSLSSLPKLSTLHLQDNELTGTLDVLVDLPLNDLNVANNNFSGWIPDELISIPNFIYNGNSFANSPAPPSPRFTSPPPSRRSHNRSRSPPELHKEQGSDAQPPNPDNSNRNRKKGLSAGAIIGIVLGSLSLVLFAIFGLVFCLRRFKWKAIAARPSAGRLTGNTNKVLVSREALEQRAIDLKPLPMEKMTVDSIQGRNGSLKRVNSAISATPYTVAALQTATNSFCQESLVGEGSIGRVYRADFPNGKILAIKKIDSAVLSLQEEEDNFLEVVTKMSKLRHTNIVPLVGYCVEHGQRLLVFEYVKNGSLHDMLHFADEGNKMLTWNARVKVALGTARALEYLHEVCLPSIVHRNFKSANILLDDGLNPQLSDCGLAALTPNMENQVTSTQMVGSFGYSAPEFVLSGIYTVKSDVYSFGVVMLELLTGRKPLDTSRARSEQSLVRWATPQLHDIDALAKMVDPTLNGMYPAKSLSRFADIIALCVQPEPEFRPPMSEVVQALVRLVQRASVVTRQSSDEPGFAYRTPEHDSTDMPF